MAGGPTRSSEYAHETGQGAQIFPAGRRVGATFAHDGQRAVPEPLTLLAQPHPLRPH
jgi:hypothetical protein